MHQNSNLNVLGNYSIPKRPEAQAGEGLHKLQMGKNLIEKYCC